jgi:beta-phosphoglucomutase-like phosphatase (HAD superfamily)
MPGIAAIVFDFDGVLADSEPLHLRAYQKVLAEAGIGLDRDEYYQRYLGFDDAGALEAIGRARGQQWNARQIAALVERKTVLFDETLASVNVMYPQAAACVERLARAFPLGIASGALRHEIVAILEHAGLERHFRFIVAAGDTAASKPAPDPYRRAAELHGLPPAACLAIEDSRWGIESARSAGLRCVGITTSYAAHELAAADAIIGSLDELTVEMIGRL